MASQPAPYNSPHQFSQQCFSWIEASWNRLIGLKWGKTNDGYLICSRELYLQSLLWLAMYSCISQLLRLHIQWFSSCLLQISASFWMLSVAFPPWEHKYKHLCVLPCSPLNPAFSKGNVLPFSELNFTFGKEESSTTTAIVLLEIWGETMQPALLLDSVRFLCF